MIYSNSHALTSKPSFTRPPYLIMLLIALFDIDLIFPQSVNVSLTYQTLRTRMMNPKSARLENANVPTRSGWLTTAMRPSESMHNRHLNALVWLADGYMFTVVRGVKLPQGLPRRRVLHG